MKKQKHYKRWQWYVSLITLSPIMVAYFLCQLLSETLELLSNLTDVSNLSTPKWIIKIIDWGLGK